MWPNPTTLQPHRKCVCAPLPSLGVCGKQKEERIPLCTLHKTRSYITLSELLPLVVLWPCTTNWSLSSKECTQGLKSNASHFFKVLNQTAQVHLVLEVMSLSFYPQIRGWNRVFANGSGRVRRGNRGVRHQPFLLPSGPIWDWHPGMKTCWTSSLSSLPARTLKWNQAMHIAALSECCCCCLFYKPPLCSRQFEQASPACLIQSLIVKKNKHMTGLFSCWLAFRCRNTPAAATVESARPDANSWRGFTTCGPTASKDF